MDDDYIVRWLVKEFNGHKIHWREHEETRDTLTTAEALFTQIKRKPSTFYARISWGDTIIKEYRRD